MKGYIISLVEFDYPDNGETPKYREIKNKWFVLDEQPKETIFNDIPTTMERMVEALDTREIAWKEVISEIDRKISQ